MVRVAIPAGAVTAEQYLALDDLADRYGNGTLRITTRQGFQFHGVLKGDLKATIAGINHTCSPPSPPAATSSATSWAAPPRWPTPTTPRCAG